MCPWSSQLQSGPFSSLDNSIMIIFLMPHMRQQEKPHVRAACCCQHQCKSESKSWNKKYEIKQQRTPRWAPLNLSWANCHCCFQEIYLLVFLYVSVNLRIGIVKNYPQNIKKLQTFLFLKPTFYACWGKLKFIGESLLF